MENKICKYCGKIISPYSQRRTTCSNWCAYKYYDNKKKGKPMPKDNIVVDK